MYNTSFSISRIHLIFKYTWNISQNRSHYDSKTKFNTCKNYSSYLKSSLITSEFNCQLFSRSVLSISLWLHGLQHARLPCPSLSPWVCSDSCPLSQWCYLTILSSAVPFSCLQSFPASGSFLKNQFFTSGGQSIGASTSASVLPIIQGWFPLGLIDLTSLLPKGLSRTFSWQGGEVT